MKWIEYEKAIVLEALEKSSFSEKWIDVYAEKYNTKAGEKWKREIVT